LEDECFLEECEDNFDIIQPVPKERKLYQSSISFDCEDMASSYGSGGERGVRRFFGAAGTIEVEDFKREFTMWCELQKSHNPNFNPYMQGCHTGRLEAFWQANRAGRRAALSITPYMNHAGYCR
jgi:hypothetical protein